MNERKPQRRSKTGVDWLALDCANLGRIVRRSTLEACALHFAMEGEDDANRAANALSLHAESRLSEEVGT